MKPAILVSIALGILLLAGARPPAADPKIYEDAYNWAHPNEVKVAPEELLIRLPDSPYYRARSFAFIGRLHEGIAFSIDLFQWVYGSSMNTWGLTVQVAELSGELYHYDDKIAWQSVEDAPQLFHIRFANGEIQGQDGDQRVRLELPEFSCDLRIRNLIPPWKPGDGYAYYGSGKEIYSHLLLAAPLASVNGEMTIKGRTIQADGWCTASRSLTVLPLSKLGTVYFGWQVFSPDPSVEPWFLELHHYESREEQNPLRIPMLVLAHGSRWVLTTKQYSLSPEQLVEQEGIPHPYPKKLRIHAEAEGYTLDGYFTSYKVIRFQDVFKSLPALLGAIASLFQKSPLIFRTIGDFQGTLLTPEGAVQDLNLSGLGSYTTFD
jgi:hypothetical protein